MNYSLFLFLFIYFLLLFWCHNFFHGLGINVPLQSLDFSVLCAILSISSFFPLPGTLSSTDLTHYSFLFLSFHLNSTFYLFFLLNCSGSCTYLPIAIAGPGNRKPHITDLDSGGDRHGTLNPNQMWWRQGRNSVCCSNKCKEQSGKLFLWSDN